MKPAQRAAMRFAVSEREGAAPRAAEHEPALDLEVLPQPLDIGDEVRGRVLLQLPERRGAARPALIENYDAVARGIEKAAVGRRGARPGSAVQEQDRHAVRIADCSQYMRCTPSSLSMPEPYGSISGRARRGRGGRCQP
jgi:hypothetical protein